MNQINCYSAFLENSGIEEMLRKAAHSENTRIAYEKGWRSFEYYCKEIDLNPLKATAADVIDFLVAMASDGQTRSGRPLALNTLKLYRSALNYQWRSMQLPSPASDRSVDELLKGLARLRYAPPRRVKALREYQILEILKSCGEGMHGLRDAAIISLGFAAALRRSELCFLQMGDLQRKEDEGMIVRVRQSKTDQLGIGQSVAVLEGKFVKPLKHLERWLRKAEISHGFVFQTLHRGGMASGRPLDPGDIARIVKRHVQRIGLDPQDYSGHSLRAGFVTSAAAHHARIDKIMEVTRHKNAEMVLKYIRDEESFFDHAGASFL